MAKVDDKATTPARRKRQTRATAPEVMPLPHPIPERPETSEEVAQSKGLLRRMETLIQQLRQRNLDRAAQLALQAQAGRGPLIKHFAELGRRFGPDLEKRRSSKLRLIDGGRKA